MRDNWTQVESHFPEHWTKIELWALVQKLGEWQRRPGPLKNRLRDALIRLVLDGELLHGTRLPSERDLAKALAVSRNTVAGSYALLAESEYAASRRGSGTIVQFREQKSGFVRRSEDISGSPLGERTQVDAGDTIDFCLTSVELPAQFFRWAIFDERELRSLTAQNAYEPRGLPALRGAIAKDISAKGVPTNPEQIVVTSGAQQALQLAMNLFVQRGDVIALENPTFFVALNLFRTAGARLAALPSRLQAAALREMLVHANARLIYCIPSHQNPTARTLTPAERGAIAAVADELQIPVIEDTVSEDLSYDGSYAPQLSSYSRSRNVITIGSLSKQLWSGLRIGWIRADERTISQLVPLKMTSDLATSLLAQAVALKSMNAIDEVRAFRRAHLEDKVRFIIKLLQQHLPQWEFAVPKGGFFLWIRLPLSDARPFVQLARRFGVRIIGGAAMSLDESSRDYIRLSFTLPHDQIATGIERLAQAWQVYASKPYVLQDGAEALVV